MRARDGIVIEQPAFALLHKTFRYGIYRCEQNNYPEKNIPDNFVAGAALKAGIKLKRYITNKHGWNYIQQHAIKRVFWAPLQQNFLFKKLPGLIHKFHGAKVVIRD